MEDGIERGGSHDGDPVDLRATTPYIGDDSHAPEGPTDTSIPFTGPGDPPSSPNVRNVTPCYGAPCEGPDQSKMVGLLKGHEEILVNIFTRLDQCSLARCYRLCKALHNLLSSNSAVALHQLLLVSSLRLNGRSLLTKPNEPPIQLSSAKLLEMLRTKLYRWKYLRPRSVEDYKLLQPEGRHYDYREGVLLRGVGDLWESPTEVAVYDLRKVERWLDGEVYNAVGQGLRVEGSGWGTAAGAVEHDVGGQGVDQPRKEVGQFPLRTSKQFPFEIVWLVMDPGTDLLIIVELREASPRSSTMYFHLLSLSSFEPHTRAAHAELEWPEPVPVYQRKVKLGFQICDDSVLVLHKQREWSHDMVCGWQWTTGHRFVVLHASPDMSFEGLILLTPSSFVIPTIVANRDPASSPHDSPENDRSWTHHLRLYAYPPFLSDPPQTFHAATHVATIDLSIFNAVPMRARSRPRMTIRADPPPRHTLPTQPPDLPMRFCPEPESGICVLEISPETPRETIPYCVMFLHKRTLIQYLPPQGRILLGQPFLGPELVPWNSFAPSVRLFGPILETTLWVSYVYQNRYVATMRGGDRRRVIRQYDFDPLRVRHEQLCRIYSTEPVDGERDGVHLVTAETVLAGDWPLTAEARTGRDMPYTFVEMETEAEDEDTLIDGDRLIAVRPQIGPQGFEHRRAELRVMNF